MSDEKCAARLPRELQSRMDDIRLALDAVEAADMPPNLGDRSICSECEEPIVYEALSTDDDEYDYGWEHIDTNERACVEGSATLAQPIDYEDALERIQEYPLAVSKRTVVRVELSWGGPQDYFEAELDEDHRLGSITYHFADWFDHAERGLSGDDADAIEQWINVAVPLDAL